MWNVDTYFQKGRKQMSYDAPIILTKGNVLPQVDFTPPANGFNIYFR